jgi:hypothetical protein
MSYNKIKENNERIIIINKNKEINKEIKQRNKTKK